MYNNFFPPMPQNPYMQSLQPTTPKQEVVKVNGENGAEEYAKCAEECRAEHPKLSAKLHELASEEMNHMRQLHGEVTKIIEEYKVKNGEPPKEMLAIYNYEHQKQISRAAVIKQLIAEYQ